MLKLITTSPQTSFFIFYFFIYTAVVQGTLVSASTGTVIAAMIRKNPSFGAALITDKCNYEGRRAALQ